MAAKIIGSMFGGNPTISVAKKELAYPLYGADFDPQNYHFLLVGGGGGSSSTGVPNRISLLDTSNRSEIKEVADIELAPEEDSVSSLAIAYSDEQSLLAYAGINGSERDKKDGKNEHFRSFRVPLPAKRKKDVSESAQITNTVAATQPLARTTLFRNPAGAKNECYQRVLRLSPPVTEDATTDSEKPTTSSKRLRKRIAAIASGLAPQNEVVTFTAEQSPSTNSLLSRIDLQKQEAEDVDIANVEGDRNSFALAYCADTELFLQQLDDQASTTKPKAVQVYETTKGPEGRSKIRALRWLTPRYLLLLQNRCNKSGVELVILKISKDYAQAQQVMVKYLRRMKQAVGLDTCTLSKGQDGSQQFVMAVAGQDSSLQIFALDRLPDQGFTSFKQYADVIDLHNGPITRVVFSKFVGPPLPISAQTPPQHIRLATIGVDKNVIVQTLPLRPTPGTGTGNTKPRYILISTSEEFSVMKSTFAAVYVLMLVLIITLALLEARGVIPPTIGASKYLPQRWQTQYSKPYAYHHDNPGPVIPDSIPAVESAFDRIKLSEVTPVIEKLQDISDSIKLADVTPIIEQMQKAVSSVPSVQDVQDSLGNAASSVPSVQDVQDSLGNAASSIPSVQDVQDTLAGLVSQKRDEHAHADKAVIVRDLEHMGGELSAELKHEADIVREGTLKKWEDLSKQDQKTWQRKLKDAGQWTEQQGEAVLKGVFFGQLAGLVGEFVRG